MPYSEDRALERRVAFWDNLIWKLHQIIKDAENETANKWPNEQDMTAIELSLSYLRKADYAMLSRYHEVLGDKWTAMKVEAGA